MTVSYFRGHIDNMLMIFASKKGTYYKKGNTVVDNITKMHMQYFWKMKMFYLFYFMAFKDQNPLAFSPYDTFI